VLFEVSCGVLPSCWSCLSSYRPAPNWCPSRPTPTERPTDRPTERRTDRRVTEPSLDESRQVRARGKKEVLVVSSLRYSCTQRGPTSPFVIVVLDRQSSVMDPSSIAAQEQGVGQVLVRQRLNANEDAHDGLHVAFVAHKGGKAQQNSCHSTFH